HLQALTRKWARNKPTRPTPRPQVMLRGKLSAMTKQMIMFRPSTQSRMPEQRRQPTLNAERVVAIQAIKDAPNQCLVPAALQLPALRPCLALAHCPFS
ncbi:hypothetical protein GGH92_008508, partial [Coemansia sp. RSA 2673]